MIESDILGLMDLAKVKSAEARSRLVENITDLFLRDEGRLTDQERALMSDILAKLIGQVEKSIKKELSEALAASGVELPDIAAMLANEDVEIARPLLEKSSLLKDPDLIEIIRMRTDEHRIAIARRGEVSMDVSNAIVDEGDDDAIEALLTNHDAKLSERAMEYLVAESRRVDRFQEPLIGRSDLSPDLAYRMFWWVSAALRQRILADHKIDPVALESAVKRAASAALVDQKDEDGAYVKAQKLARRMMENGELTVQFLLQSLRQRRTPIFVAGLAVLGGIGFRVAWRIFADKGGESFAVIAKAVDMDRSQFTSCYLLMSELKGKQGVSAPKVVNRILALFDSISHADAKAALLIWQRDDVYQDAIEELEGAA